jgi:hypothetical protein
MESVVVVVPTIREECIRAFLDAWRQGLSGAQVLVIEDNPHKTFNLGDHANVTHYAWDDIDADLGDKSWIIPRRTDCVRSYGYFKAAQLHPSMVVTLDDDCYPVGDGGDFLESHWERLRQPAKSAAWRSTVEQVLPRGVPYYQQEREADCVLNHGLWAGVPDFDAPTQLLSARTVIGCTHLDQTIPVGSYFPMCGMNLAFRPQVIPALYFMLMGRDYPYDRFGDIWAGLFVKKIADHLGFAVTSGRPAILHKRASNVWSNLRKEAAGLEVNEQLWRSLDRVVLTRETFQDCYWELAEKLDMHGDYWARLREAMKTWACLFADLASVSGGSGGEEGRLRLALEAYKRTGRAQAA